MTTPALCDYHGTFAPVVYLLTPPKGGGAPLANQASALGHFIYGTPFTVATRTRQLHESQHKQRE